MLKSAVKEIYTNELHQTLNAMTDIDEILEVLVDKMKSALSVAFAKINQGEEVSFFGHENKLTEFCKRAENGEIFEEMLQEEIDTEKYSIYHYLNRLQKKYEEQLDFDLDWVARVLERQKNKTIDEIRDMLVFMGQKSLFADCSCRNCGFNFSRMNTKDGYCEVETCEMQGIGVTEVEIEIPSGTMFAADWLRDKENTLKSLTDVENTKIGKEFVKKYEYQAKYGDSYLAEFVQVLSSAEVNVASCFVGNSSPIIFSNDTSIVAVEENYDEEENLKNENNLEGWKRHGRICTDLWRCTFVDKQVLESYLMEKYSPKEVDKLMKGFEKDTNVIKFKVTPGKYKLSFNVSDVFLPGDENNKYQKYMKLELVE